MCMCGSALVCFCAHVHMWVSQCVRLHVVSNINNYVSLTPPFHVWVHVLQKIDFDYH